MPNLIKSLITGISSDHQLIELANLLNTNLSDVLDINEIDKPLNKNKIYLILLNSDGGVGHWTAVYHDTYFDSMGEGPPIKLKIKNYNHKQYQSTYGEYCGIWCLLWLSCMQNNRMDLFDGFHDLNNKKFEE